MSLGCCDRADVGLWGDMGDGTYRNPILFADYSDPDACRVGDDYYMICSEMNYMGMPVLHSKDLVNWELVGRVFDLLPGKQYDNFERYGRGSWAPTIRYHDGEFYIYFCTPEEGLFLAKTRDVRGEWRLIHVKEVEGWEDPSPVWDDDGNMYLTRSILGAGPIYLHKMSKDGETVLDEGRIIYKGFGSEGSKWYKIGGEYLLMIPEGGTALGWQYALRGKSPEGPFEGMKVCEQGNTWINGPHQGALLDTPSGEWWFLHFSSCGVAGRITYLEPVTFVDGWPVIGERRGEGYTGEPVSHYRKPDLPVQEISLAATSDDFSSGKLGLQWQWNHNPRNDKWSLSENPGHMRLYGSGICPDMRKVPNILTQRMIGASGCIRVKISAGGLDVGQSAGLVLFGQDSSAVSVLRKEDGYYVTVGFHNELGSIAEGPFKDGEIYLQSATQSLSETHFSFSTDGENYKILRYDVFLSEGEWKGTRIGLYTAGGEGYADFSDFRYVHDGPCGRRAKK